MKKRNRGRLAKRNFKRALTGLILMLIISCSFGAFLVSAHEDSKIENTVYYKSIEIKSGDTLWEIAEDNLTDEYSSVPEYVQALKEMNNLDSDQIQTGRNLIIACSTSEYTD